MTNFFEKKIEKVFFLKNYALSLQPKNKATMTKFYFTYSYFYFYFWQ
jgi:hypothetical protein